MALGQIVMSIVMRRTPKAIETAKLSKTHLQCAPFINRYQKSSFNSFKQWPVWVRQYCIFFLNASEFLFEFSPIVIGEGVSGKDWPQGSQRAFYAMFLIKIPPPLPAAIGLQREFSFAP